jgi:polyphenol oxidase
MRMSSGKSIYPSRCFPKTVQFFISNKLANFAFVSGVAGLTSDQKDYLKIQAHLDADKLVNIKQVHGKGIVVVRKDDETGNIQEADAIITDRINVPIAVRTADCLSILLYDPVSKCIGAVHAGWKGTKERIVTETLLAMNREYGTNAQAVKIVFGPCIRRCCYEVGAEFGEYFPDEVFVKGTSFHFDLPLANKNQLLEAGVSEDNIHDGELCTFCSNEYHSYRRDNDAAGRMISIIMMKS